MLYIVNGRGVFSNDEGEHEVTKGTIILLRPGKWHTYKPLKGEGWSEYFIGFSGEMADRSIGMLFQNDKQIFNVGFNRDLVDLYQHAIEIAADDKPSTQQLLCGIVMYMLGMINYTMRNNALPPTVWIRSWSRPRPSCRSACCKASIRRSWPHS